MSDWTTFTEPALLRIAACTATVPDLAAAEACYRDWLGYRTIERGHVDPQLASGWLAPGAAGAACCTMTPDGEDDVFIRLVETPPVPGYQPLTTFGWSAFEIIVEDVYALSEQLESGPFRFLDTPHPLQFMPSIVAMQVAGPGGECLYFTTETGARDTSLLPPPSGFVGRPFIVVAGGPDFNAMLRWYVDNFELRERPVRNSKVAIVQRAQGLDPEHAIQLSAIGLRERGNLLELDGYPHGPGYVTGPRPRAEGCLPPGNAIVSFEVADLDRYAHLAKTAPRSRPEAVYAGRRVSTLVGPAGELVELIERG